jgi:hypothetical protein
MINCLNGHRKSFGLSIIILILILVSTVEYFPQVFARNHSSHSSHSISSLENACMRDLQLTKDQCDQEIVKSIQQSSSTQQLSNNPTIITNNIKPLEVACMKNLHLAKDQCDQTIVGGGSVLLCVPQQVVPGFLGRVVGQVVRTVTGSSSSCQ